MDRLKILLADDHDGFRSVLASFLRAQEDIELIGEAVDGNDAVSMSEQLHPDVVLMDIRMPRKNGIEATKAIKFSRPQTRVFMMSLDTSEIYQRKVQMIADGVLAKLSIKGQLLALLAAEQSRVVRLGGTAAA